MGIPARPRPPGGPTMPGEAELYEITHDFDGSSGFSTWGTNRVCRNTSLVVCGSAHPISPWVPPGPLMISSAFLHWGCFLQLPRPSLDPHWASGHPCQWASAHPRSSSCQHAAGGLPVARGLRQGDCGVLSHPVPCPSSFGRACRGFSS